MSIGGYKGHVQSGQDCNQRVQDAIRVRLGVGVRRFDLAERTGNDQQSLRIGTHGAEPFDKYRAFRGEGLHQVGQILAFADAIVF